VATCAPTLVKYCTKVSASDAAKITTDAADNVAQSIFSLLAFDTCPVYLAKHSLAVYIGELVPGSDSSVLADIPSDGCMFGKNEGACAPPAPPVGYPACV
jgi:hypothetical protein